MFLLWMLFRLAICNDRIRTHGVEIWSSWLYHLSEILARLIVIFWYYILPYVVVGIEHMALKTEQVYDTIDHNPG